MSVATAPRAGNSLAVSFYAGRVRLLRGHRGVLRAPPRRARETLTAAQPVDLAGGVPARQVRLGACPRGC